MMNGQNVWRCVAIAPGVLRMPAPTALPIVTASPNPTPRTASRWPRETGAVVEVTGMSGGDSVNRSWLLPVASCPGFFA
jgi:hypothetical protein